MQSNIPINIQQAWHLYNCTEAQLTFLWETYEHDFLEHYFPEIRGHPPQPQDRGPDFDDDDIRF